MASLLLPSCKSAPVPSPAEEPAPSASLVFKDIEAASPERLKLNFTLETEVPLPSAGQARIESWRVELNGQKAGKGFTLEKPEASPQAGAQPLIQKFSLGLSMDISSLAAQGLAPADEYQVNLILNLSFVGNGEADQNSSPSGELEVSGIAVFPGVQAPVFSIQSIAILKAELINTRFRVGLKIDNPNPYPVELSSFGYELYGNGRLWADGTEKNIIRVPGKSYVEGNLFLIMNFINMKRDLLDQIIRLEDVNYRFTGDAQVGTGVEYLPKFKTGFDLSGYSQVFDN